MIEFDCKIRFCIDFKAFIRLVIDRSWPLWLSASSAIDFISLARRHSVDELEYLSLFLVGMVGNDVRRLNTSVELLLEDELPPVSLRRGLLKLLVDVFDDLEIFKLL